jgi:hypothetical protein
MERELIKALDQCLQHIEFLNFQICRGSTMATLEKLQLLPGYVEGRKLLDKLKPASVL